jgi:hypothetical protein
MHCLHIENRETAQASGHAMTTNTITPTGLPTRTPSTAMRLNHEPSPVTWFSEDNKTVDDDAYADIWIDHHRVAHARDPARPGMTRCDIRIIGSDAPSHARVCVVGCRACAAAHVRAP